MEEYLRVGSVIVMLNLLARMIEGAPWVKGVRAEAMLLRIPFRTHWTFALAYVLVLWPFTVVHLLAKLLGFVPRNSWQELNERW